MRECGNDFPLVQQLGELVPEGSEPEKRMRSLVYAFTFRGDEGQAYTFAGEKALVGRDCLASFTLLVGAIRDGEPGFGVLVGGGMSSVPRIARELGAWVSYDHALDVLRAILDAWSEDLRYRVSRVKSRRIQAMLGSIAAERGSLDLEPLATAPSVEAIEFLERLPGVGRKTGA